MKVLLIDPCWYSLQKQSNYISSVGLAYLGSYLKNKGHECLIYNGDFILKSETTHGDLLIDYEHYVSNIESDNNPYINKTLEELGRVMEEFKPDVVGITIITAKYGIAKKIAKKLKEINPKIKIVVGGIHPTSLPEETVKEEEFDIVVRGEGEVSFYNLIESLEKKKPLKNVKGITYKVNKKIIENLPELRVEDINSLPSPEWDLFYKWEEFHPNSFGSIISSRGCPYDCTFCASKRLWGRKVRFRTPKNIFDEVKNTHKKYGTTIFRFNDDTFTLDNKRTTEFCNMLIHEKLNIKWGCDTRVDSIDLPLLKLMKKAGCFQVCFGIESGSKEILKVIKKGINLDKVRTAFKLTKKAKLESVGYFMMGFPTETKKQVWDTIRLCDEIKPDIFRWSLATPFVGTELYEIAKERNLLPKIKDWSRYFVYSSDMGLSENLTKEDKKELLEEIRKRSKRMSKRNDMKRKKGYFLHPIETSKKITKKVFNFSSKILKTYT
ncbi:MAG: B12-binding domain-containing radical SAM protein [Nanoarchaeota archaeon]|nr:B12-binding domain-containing radical SAM protein [Nanoarchaeota archaeon]